MHGGPPGKLKAAASALFRAAEQPPSDDELNAWGFTREDVAADSECEVWPDVWPVLRIFVDLMTQWRVSMSGYVGLDYAAIPFVFDMRDVATVNRTAMFDDLRVMEAAALETLRGRK